MITVRKFRRLAIQNFERQNRGHVFSWDGRKFDRGGDNIIKHYSSILVVVFPEKN